MKFAVLAVISLCVALATSEANRNVIYYWISFVSLMIGVIYPIKWGLKNFDKRNKIRTINFFNLAYANIFYNIANSIYYYRGIHGIGAYNASKGLAELCYFQYSVLFFLYFKQTTWHYIKKDRAAVYLTFFLAALLFIVCIKYILIPFIPLYYKAGPLANLLRFTANSYTIAFVGATALAIVGGFLTSNILDFFFCVSIVLQYTSGFAIRYYIAANGNNSITSYEFFTVLAWVVHAGILLEYARRRELPFANKLMPIASERFWYTIRPSLSTVITVCILIAVIAPTNSSFNVTLISTALVGIWIYFNFQSLRFSNGILTITRDAVKNGIDAYFRNAGPHKDIGESLNGLVPKTEELRILLYETVKYAEDRSHEKSLIEFGKHAAVMAHQIDPSIGLLSNKMDALGIKYKAFNDDDFLHTRKLVQRIAAYQQRLNNPTTFIDGKLCDLSIAIQSAVADSQTIYFSRLDVNIQYIDHIKRGIFVSCPDFDATTLFQSLIKNAVESQRIEKINVSVEYSVNPSKKTVTVKITDNGRGIPEKIIKNFGSFGNSEGKDSGKGLGIYHAYSWIKEALKGDFLIDVRLNEGTTLSLIIPYETPPLWSCQTIHIPEDCSIVILDDDKLIHEHFRLFLKSAGLAARNIQLESFTKEDELISYLRSISETNKRNIFFLDYFLDSKKLDINRFKEFDIFGQAIICTTAASDSTLLACVKETKLKLCSKSQLFELGFQLIYRDCQLVHVEHDEFWTEMWKFEAEKYDIKYVAFPNYHELKRNLEFIPKSARIVLDVEFENGISGIDAVIELNQLKYSHLCLSTGYKPEKFGDFKKKVDGLIVLGKNPDLARLNLVAKEKVENSSSISVGATAFREESSLSETPY